MDQFTLPDSPHALRYLYTLEFVQGRLNRQSRAHTVLDRFGFEERLRDRPTAWLAEQRILYVGSRTADGLALLTAEGEPSDTEVARSGMALFGLLQGAIATLDSGRLEAAQYPLGRADEGVAALQAQLLFPAYVAETVQDDQRQGLLDGNASNRYGAVQSFMAEALGYSAEVRGVPLTQVLDEWTHAGGGVASFDQFSESLARGIAGVEDPRLAQAVARRMRGGLLSLIARPGAYGRNIGQTMGVELTTRFRGLVPTPVTGPRSGDRTLG